MKAMKEMCPLAKRTKKDKEEGLDKVAARISVGCFQRRRVTEMPGLLFVFTAVFLKDLATNFGPCPAHGLCMQFAGSRTGSPVTNANKLRVPVGLLLACKSNF